MKNAIYFFLFLLSPVLSYSQIDGEDEVYLDGSKIDAKFRGDDTMDEFGKFIRSEFDYSKVTKPGTMIFSFTVDENGDVKNIKVVQMLDIESATEIIRVMKKCPKWEPAKRKGKPFSIEVKYPMTFRDKSNDLTKSENRNNSNNKNHGVQKTPEFGGGLTGFHEFIAKNFIVPDELKIKGEILVTFTVDTDGSLTDIKVIKDLGYGTREETIRVLKKSPKWKPGTQNNIPVKCQYSLPITINKK